MPKIDRKTFEKWQKGEIKLATLFGVESKQLAGLLLTGHNLFSEGHLEEARLIFEGITILDNKNSYAFSSLGAIYQRLEQHDLAIKRYNQALELYPDDINALTNRGELYLRLGKFEEAAADLRKAISLDPAKEHVPSNRARMLVALTTNALKAAKENGIEAVIKPAEKGEPK